MTPPTRRAHALVGVVLGLLVLAGCGTTAPAAPAAPASAPVSSVPTSPAPTSSALTSSPMPSAPPEAGAVLTESRAQRLIIPALDVDTATMNLGLRADGTMEVPPDATTAGWYDRSPTPGEVGPAVFAAHVDWRGEQGVFFRLAELVPGDEVRVRRADGVTAVFAVRSVEQYPKDDFPSQAVYGDVDGPELRLITCGGDFDSGAGSYRDNIVVYAELTGAA